MKVFKFGGTSIGNRKGFKNIINIINMEKNIPLFIVVSAFGDTTDKLFMIGNLAKKKDILYKKELSTVLEFHKELLEKNFRSNVLVENLTFLEERFKEIELILNSVFNLEEFSDRTNDQLLSYGEIISSKLLNSYLNDNNINSKLLNSKDIIKTDNNYGKANVDFEITKKNIDQLEKNNKVYILQGFVSSSNENITTTLGRGGSDYTASILAAFLNADNLVIWTDVDGMLTADPNIVNNTITLPELSYKEALELCNFGARVIYPPTIIPVMNKNIPIKIKNTFNPKGIGTIIKKNNDNNKLLITGLASIENVCAITIEGSGMVGVPGFTKKFLEIISNEYINVIMVSQTSSEHGLTLILSPKDLDKALKSLYKGLKYELDLKIIESIEYDENLSILALVGKNMKKYHGIAGKAFNVLGRNGINIRAITQSSSQYNITTVISKKDLKKALNVLHEEFFEEQIKHINLFITGLGTIGSKLIEQIKKQKMYLLDNNNLKINIISIANSKKMLFDENGLDVDSKNDLEKKGTKILLDDFSDKIIKLNLRNSIFVDNTASKEVSNYYDKFLSNGVGVVTCNKIAASSDYKTYLKLKKLSKINKAPYLFETNVGAGLPIINTLNDLIKSGDKLIKIKAVLSGSLTYIMNNFKEGTKFVDVVKKAMELGYTEPDPRIDLSGLDVKRKLLILLREAGFKIKLEDIKSGNFIGEEYFKTNSVKEFLDMLEKNNTYFENLRKNAEDKLKKLKIVASYQNGKALVGLEEVDNKSPYYQLEGSDNIVLFYTERYGKLPMIIKGAGAGADVTASGVFADIIRSVN